MGDYEYGLVKKNNLNWYELYKIFYNKNGTINPSIMDDIDFYGNSIEEIKEKIDKLMQIFNKPILIWEENKGIIGEINMSPYEKISQVKNLED